MDRQKLVDRFEAEMGKAQRPGVDRLMEYIRKSDFYTAPASTKYHLSCEGGLLQHSLNVLDALRGILVYSPVDNTWQYQVAGRVPAIIPDESVTITALLHDLCKTYYYGTSTRNVKNEATGKWEKQPFYTVKDRMPLGHGPKSAMLAKEYIKLEPAEMYAIWWHMGYSDTQDFQSLNAAIQEYPLVWALHTADVQAMNFMEDEKGNKPPFDRDATEAHADPEPESAGEYADAPATGEPDFQEAPPLQEGA